MSLAIFRYAVPVDDGVHNIELSGGSRIVHVGSRDPSVVEFWAVHDDDIPAEVRQFKVFSTGHLLPRGLDIRHHGSVITAGGAYVWHLCEFPR